MIRRAGMAEGRTARCIVAAPNGIGLLPGDAARVVAETITARLWRFDVTAPGVARVTDGRPARALGLDFRVDDDTAPIGCDTDHRREHFHGQSARASFFSVGSGGEVIT